MIAAGLSSFCYCAVTAVVDAEAFANHCTGVTGLKKEADRLPFFMSFIQQTAFSNTSK